MDDTFSRCAKYIVLLGERVCAFPHKACVAHFYTLNEALANLVLVLFAVERMYARGRGNI